jgi:hypothetical protein
MNATFHLFDGLLGGEGQRPHDRAKDHDDGYGGISDEKALQGESRGLVHKLRVWRYYKKRVRPVRVRAL